MRVGLRDAKPSNFSDQYIESNSANCQVTDKGVRQLIRLDRLVELRISKRWYKVVGSDDLISKEVFEGVVLNMRKLAVLDMQLPKVRELNISKMNTMQV